MQYRNPIIPGFNPDPSICSCGKDYYLVTSSFEFFPGVPIYHSRNLVNWELLGHCLDRPGQLPLNGCPASKGIYAPTIRFHEGVFYMTTTNTTGGGNFIVHTKDIRGPWSDPVYIEQKGIDPSLLFLDGKVYFCSNAGMEGDPKGIYVCEIDPLTGERRSPSICISHGCGGKAVEAPHLYFINGWYYLILAEGGTEYGHMVTLQRSRDLYGPYENGPHNPILTHRNRWRHPIQATGHADLFEDTQGNWWMVCLGIRPLPLGSLMLHNLGRETFLAPVRWEAGWPIVGNDGLIELEMDGPLPEPPLPESHDFTGDFTGEKLSPHWNYVRNPVPSRYCLKNGRLLLDGSDETLSGMNPTFIGIRQPSFIMKAETSISAEPAAGTRTGICAYYNDSYHYEICLERSGEGLHVLVNKRIHDMEAISFKQLLPNLKGDVELRIQADIGWYYFSYRLPGGEWQDCGGGMTAGLCTEGTHTMTFTGVYIGLFSTGGRASFGGFTLTENI
ncbi:glycoside hydrolase 43 family protein [Spirochaetia bacterium]|nr:glycoside hydrolase 43 family protein [Spirochaetia bacterium]